MSSDDTPETEPTLVRVRRRRRALNTSNEPVVVAAPDPLDPGPIVNYPPLPLGPDGLPRSADIKQRIRDLRAVSHAAYMEFVLRILHAFLLAHRPMDEIARSFGVTINTVYRWRRELTKQIGQELRGKNPTDLIAGQLMHYERAKAYAWQQASITTDHTEKQRWVMIALRAEHQTTDLYARGGMYKDTVLTPKQQADVDDMGGAGFLAVMAKSFLTGGYSHAKKQLMLPSPDDDAVGEHDVADLL